MTPEQSRAPDLPQDLQRLIALLAQRAGGAVPAAEMGEVIVGAWVQIDAALKPIVGSRSVAMLFKRSLFLTAATHAWLSEAADGLPEEMNLDGLRRALGERSSADIAVGGGALLKNFEALLASLVGSSLSERLLRSVWTNLLSGAAAKDSPP